MPTKRSKILITLTFLTVKAESEYISNLKKRSFFGAFLALYFALRETLFKTEDEIGTETLALHFFATEIGHKNVQILLKLAETLHKGCTFL